MPLSGSSNLFDLCSVTGNPSRGTPKKTRIGEMDDWVGLVARLTPSELRMLAVLCKNPGCTNLQLAKCLSVTKSCVEFHLRNIYRKTNVQGKACLLLLCKELGFDRVASEFAPRQLAID
jgi:DNA-binding CsgD family transcriptional regulator